MRNNYFWMPLVAVIVLGLLFMGTPAFAGDVDKTFEVKGFMCGGCPSKVEGKLSKMEGIKQVEAKYPEGTVHVVFDNSKVTEEQIKKAIEELGFKVVGEKKKA